MFSHNQSNLSKVSKALLFSYISFSNAAALSWDWKQTLSVFVWSSLRSQCTNTITRIITVRTVMFEVIFYSASRQSILWTSLCSWYCDQTRSHCCRTCSGSAAPLKKVAWQLSKDGFPPPPQLQSLDSALCVTFIKSSQGKRLYITDLCHWVLQTYLRIAPNTQSTLCTLYSCSVFLFTCYY